MDNFKSNPRIQRERGEISFQEGHEDWGGDDVERKTVWGGGKGELLDSGKEEVVVVEGGGSNMYVGGVGVEEGVRDCYVVNDGDVFVSFAFVGDWGKVVVGKALEDFLKMRIIRSCVPVASEDGGGEGEEKVVEIFEGEGIVLMFVDVEKVKIEERGRNRGD